MNEKDIRGMKFRVNTTFMIFLLTAAIGVLCLDNPNLVGIAIIFLSFLIYNCFSTLYKLILLRSKIGN